MKKPDERASCIYMARVYLAQARTQRNRNEWHATLLCWAARQRLAAMRGVLL